MKKKNKKKQIYKPSNQDGETMRVSKLALSKIVTLKIRRSV